MYPNPAFSSGSYADMLSGTLLFPHNNAESGGAQKFITAVGDRLTLHPIDRHSNAATSDPACTSFAGDSRTHCFGVVDSDQQNIQCQGLSLSLGTMMPSIASPSPFQYQYPSTGFSSLMTASIPNLKGSVSLNDDEASLHKELRSAESLHGSPGFSNLVLNSQYLKAAQELLDEIVNVQKALKLPGLEKQQNLGDGSKDSSNGKSTSQSVQLSSGPIGSTTNSSSEPSPAERQNLLDKKTKLLSMLDEVDKRYRQYCHQMQIVVSSFDMVAGCGAAEPYTALALRTISRHFRCLRDAISGQIQVTQRSLGEQEGIPRLRYVDRQLRQQKALQQLGVMRHAWRPQRGLPETSVSILRAWLFEHFLHPYPKDSEKIMLARQTGLTRNQVANWFINARVRLWKPMVEEMYKEEFGDSEISCNLSSENAPPKAPRDDVQVSDNKNEESQDNLITADGVQRGQLHPSSTTEFDSGIHGSGHGENVMDSRNTRLQGSDQRFNMNNNSLYSSAAIPIDQNGDGCLMVSTPSAYDLSELGNFTVGGQVSLALELRNCESSGFGAMSNDDGIHKRRNQTLASSPPENDLLDYNFADPGKQQNRFGNPHLLHEFVV